MNEKEVESEDGAVEHPVVELMDNSVETYRVDAPSLAVHVRVNRMASIPEASPPSRRSKRQAETTDQANLERAEKMKATWNLDPSPKQGTIESSEKSFLNYSREQVADNLNTIGICLGKGNLEIGNAVERLKVLENDRCGELDPKDEINNIFDLEEKEMAEEEVDKLIPNSLCSEIMDEVMDVDSAYLLECKTILKKKSPVRSQKGKSLGTKTKHSGTK
jgi:hypothetical protein